MQGEDKFHAKERHVAVNFKNIHIWCESLDQMYKNIAWHDQIPWAQTDEHY